MIKINGSLTGKCLILFLTIFIVSCKSDVSTSTTKTQESTEAVNETAPKSIVQKKTKIEGDDLAVDLSASLIHWKGNKPGGTHRGTVNLSEAKLITKDDVLVGGEFTIDMNSLDCSDLEGESKENLVNHLKGLTKGKENDFFNVAKYPTSTFVITKITPLEKSNATHLIYGEFTLKGVTRKIGFKANVLQKDGIYEISSFEFPLDRTRWGITYNSKRFFDDLKDKLIEDDIWLTLKVISDQ